MELATPVLGLSQLRLQAKAEAATVVVKGPVEVNVRGEGFLLRFDVLGYESEGRGKDSYDDNWLSGTVTLERTASCGDFQGEVRRLMADS
jgi:hypothetical protein